VGEGGAVPVVVPGHSTVAGRSRVLSLGGWLAGLMKEREAIGDGDEAGSRMRNGRLRVTARRGASFYSTVAFLVVGASR
jgi:hypothetical protein